MTEHGPEPDPAVVGQPTPWPRPDSDAAPPPPPLAYPAPTQTPTPSWEAPPLGPRRAWPPPTRPAPAAPPPSPPPAIDPLQRPAAQPDPSRPPVAGTIPFDSSIWTSPIPGPTAVGSNGHPSAAPTGPAPYLATPPTADQAVLPAPPAQPGPIETWPPLPPTQSAVGPISPITGQLRRPAPLALASVCFWLAGLGWAGAYALLWWRAASVSGFHQAARILTWTAPEPVSFWAIFMVMLTALLTVMVIGAAVAIGHNAWRGRAWTPLGGLISVVLVAGLSWLLHPWAISAAIPFAVGVGLLWLPGVRRHFAAVSAPPAGPANVPIDPTPALYGPYHPIGG